MSERVWFEFEGNVDFVRGNNFEYVADVKQAIHKKLGHHFSTSPVSIKLYLPVRRFAENNETGEVEVEEDLLEVRGDTRCRSSNGFDLFQLQGPNNGGNNDNNNNNNYNNDGGNEYPSHLIVEVTHNPHHNSNSNSRGGSRGVSPHSRPTSPIPTLASAAAGGGGSNSQPRLVSQASPSYQQQQQVQHQHRSSPVSGLNSATTELYRATTPHRNGPLFQPQPPQQQQQVQQQQVQQQNNNNNNSNPGGRVFHAPGNTTLEEFERANPRAAGMLKRNQLQQQEKQLLINQRSSSSSSSSSSQQPHGGEKSNNNNNNAYYESYVATQSQKHPEAYRQLHHQQQEHEVRVCLDITAAHRPGEVLGSLYIDLPQHLLRPSSWGNSQSQTPQARKSDDRARIRSITEIVKESVNKYVIVIESPSVPPALVRVMAYDAEFGEFVLMTETSNVHISPEFDASTGAPSSRALIAVVDYPTPAESPAITGDMRGGFSVHQPGFLRNSSSYSPSAASASASASPAAATSNHQHNQQQEQQQQQENNYQQRTPPRTPESHYANYRPASAAQQQAQSQPRRQLTSAELLQEIQHLQSQSQPIRTAVSASNTPSQLQHRPATAPASGGGYQQQYRISPSATSSSGGNNVTGSIPSPTAPSGSQIGVPPSSSSSPSQQQTYYVGASIRSPSADSSSAARNYLSTSEPRAADREQEQQYQQEEQVQQQQQQQQSNVQVTSTTDSILSKLATVMQQLTDERQRRINAERVIYERDASIADQIAQARKEASDAAREGQAARLEYLNTQFLAVQQSLEETQKKLNEANRKIVEQREEQRPPPSEDQVNTSSELTELRKAKAEQDAELDAVKQRRDMLHDQVSKATENHVAMQKELDSLRIQVSNLTLDKNQLEQALDEEKKTKHASLSPQLQREFDEKVQTLEQLVREAKEENEREKKEVSSLKSEKRTSDTSRDSALKNLEQFRDNWSKETTEKSKKIAELSEKLEALEGASSNKAKQQSEQLLEAKKDIDQLKQDLERTRLQLHEGTMNLLGEQKRVAELKTELVAANEKIANLQEENERLAAPVVGAEKALAEANKEIINLETDKKKLQEQVKDLQGTRNREKDQIEKERKETKEKIIALEAELKAEEEARQLASSNFANEQDVVNQLVLEKSALEKKVDALNKSVSQGGGGRNTPSDSARVLDLQAELERGQLQAAKTAKQHRDETENFQERVNRLQTDLAASESRNAEKQKQNDRLKAEVDTLNSLMIGSPSMSVSPASSSVIQKQQQPEQQKQQQNENNKKKSPQETPPEDFHLGGDEQDENEESMYKKEKEDYERKANELQQILHARDLENQKLKRQVDDLSSNTGSEKEAASELKQQLESLQESFTSIRQRLQTKIEKLQQQLFESQQETENVEDDLKQAKIDLEEEQESHASTKHQLQLAEKRYSVAGDDDEKMRELVSTQNQLLQERERRCRLQLDCLVHEETIERLAQIEYNEQKETEYFWKEYCNDPVISSASAEIFRKTFLSSSTGSQGLSATLPFEDIYNASSSSSSSSSSATATAAAGARRGSQAGEQQQKQVQEQQQEEQEQSGDRSDAESSVSFGLSEQSPASSTSRSSSEFNLKSPTNKKVVQASAAPEREGGGGNSPHESNFSIESTSPQVDPNVVSAASPYNKENHEQEGEGETNSNKRPATESEISFGLSEQESSVGDGPRVVNATSAAAAAAGGDSNNDYQEEQEQPGSRSPAESSVSFGISEDSSIAPAENPRRVTASSLAESQKQQEQKEQQQQEQQPPQETPEGSELNFDEGEAPERPGTAMGNNNNNNNNNTASSSSENSGTGGGKKKIPTPPIRSPQQRAAGSGEDTSSETFSLTESSGGGGGSSATGGGGGKPAPATASIAAAGRVASSPTAANTRTVPSPTSSAPVDQDEDESELDFTMDDDTEEEDKDANNKNSTSASSNNTQQKMSIRAPPVSFNQAGDGDESEFSLDSEF